MSTLHILYASTSGHTEYTLGRIAERLKDDVTVTVRRVELATPEDLLQGDVLLLASGTWNTGGVEGQLNPYMHFFLKKQAAGVDLAGKRVAILGLGDKRYRYTANALVHLRTFVETHGGTVVSEQTIVNEPYGQEEVMDAWAATLREMLLSSPAA